MEDGKVLPSSGKFFASATDRTQSWNGIQQEITGRAQRKRAYDVTAQVRTSGNSGGNADVRATLWIQSPSGREQYIGIGNVQASDKDWFRLQGKFLINGSPSRVVIFLEGPPRDVDILVDSVVVKDAGRVPPLPPPDFDNVLYGVNVIKNSNLSEDLKEWSPLGPCSLNVGEGSPLVLPPMARDSLGPREPLNGRYVLASNRTQSWMGPSQTIADRLILNVTYQISAWVRVGYGGSGPQNINVALGVDNRYVNGGQVDVNDTRWHEITGSFRIEKQPSRVIVYVQGPAPGIDLMVAGLQIFPVDRRARFKHLKKQTDKVRKRDVVLKFNGSDAVDLRGTFVRVKQIKNSFPLGSCINRSDIDNEEVVDFFLRNFNWAVFGNELKWYWTEAQKGSFNYADADELLDLCDKHGLQIRGHCIFWEVVGAVQSWVQSLSKEELMKAVQNRLTGLITRYKGKFRHYDVNNEMLHGSFYQDRLGADIRSYMFKTAHELDPSAALFANDYHVEDGTDTRASPEMYVQHILGLQAQGAPVGGIGVQGHIDYPIGIIISSALDKLGTLGLPIWFTEAEDLEVMLREAYSHPAVEGIMLWGFWELLMSRANAYLVDAEGNINEAGKRFLALKKEWLSHSNGHVDDQGEYKFRGFHGTYSIDVISSSKIFSRTFVVEKGDSPLEVTMDF
ncbi:unnamed protein product [Spirodela intermedia]|uniref:GH10 domain-containing protein n=1 Tax=Spirodela intermedia TaxID=51605 RepID=A0A7I8IIF0_SPIIN|nr:unnamed protein product [Spirodela intermedia]CAA6657653.1 unnamed protein product [Spirodela intermedia]